MKKLIAVLGSSRPGSISMKAAEAFIKGAEEAGYSTVVFNVNDMNLKGCTGCKAVAVTASTVLSTMICVII